MSEKGEPCVYCDLRGELVAALRRMRERIEAGEFPDADVDELMTDAAEPVVTEMLERYAELKIAAHARTIVEAQREEMANALAGAMQEGMTKQLTKEERTGLAALYGYELGFTEGRDSVTQEGAQ